MKTSNAANPDRYFQLFTMMDDGRWALKTSRAGCQLVSVSAMNTEPRYAQFGLSKQTDNTLFGASMMCLRDSKRSKQRKHVDLLITFNDGMSLK